MFSRLSVFGILLDNVRSISLALALTSLFAPVIRAELFLAITGIAMGAYYGYRIEKQTHEFRTLGGRIMRCRSWDYLVVA